MKARLLGGIAALVVAVLGTLLLVSYVQGADKRAFANTETTEVYVVQEPIAAGTSVSNFGDSVAKRPVPKSAVATDSVTKLSDLGQKVAAVGLVPGEQLLTSRVVEPALLLGPGRAPVPVGLQEVTVKLSMDRIVGGNIRAGDTVGVVLSFEEDEKRNVPDQSQMVFHKVLVTAVQNSSGLTTEQLKTSTEAASDGALNSKSNAQAGAEYLITLARPSTEVEKIVHAIEFGKVYLSKEPESSTTENSGVIERTKVFK